MKLKLEAFADKLKKELDINFNLTNKEIFLKNKKWDSLLNMTLLSYIDENYKIVFDVGFFLNVLFKNEFFANHKQT